MDSIEEKLVYTFVDKTLLELALVHRSYFNEHRDGLEGHNERLEFLGDTVLGLVVSSHLYNQLPNDSEGHLSHLRAYLVGAEACAEYAKKLGVEEHLLLGKGESANVGRGRDRLLSNLFEALIGAIYLDGGLKACSTFFFHHFNEDVQKALRTPLRNWKADLQDYAQKKTQRPPEYRVESQEGPPHDLTFVVSVYVDDALVGQGKGGSKKIAEQAAAEDALSQLEKEDG